MASVDNFIASIRKWQAGRQIVAAEVARGISAVAFNHIVRISPQYSGDFAANWNYAFGQPSTAFTPGALSPRPAAKERLIYRTVKRGSSLIVRSRGAKDSLRIAGDPEAINYAYQRNRGADVGFTLATVAYISNSAVHTEPYAWKIENGKIRFRSGNKGHVRRETVAYIQRVYGGPLTPAKIAALRAARVGVAIG